MENLMTSPVAELKPKELIKPMNLENLLKEEKILEACDCETRNSCGISNSSIGKNDDILF